MILAALTLLSMSLNAQLKTTKGGVVVQPNNSTEKIDTPPDGYFREGPSRASTTPVTPPYSNDFGSSALWSWWEVINANNDGTNYTWALSSNTARYRYNSSRAADDWLVTAPITLEAGKTYKFYIDTWAQSTTYPEKLEVKMASTNTATALSNGTTIIGQTTVTALSSSPLHLSNENITVSTSGNYYIGIHAISDADMYYLYVDNFVIDVAASAHDLSIALSAPANVGAGGTATLTAIVTNTGNYAESGYTVTFRDGNNNVIDTQTGGSLAIGASATFTTTYTTTASQAGQTVNFTATVACTGDEDASNNSASASTSVITLPPPENVVATAGENQTATVTWDEPSNLPKLVSGTVTEDFEDTDVFPPFSLGGITATQHTGAFGEWTLYDPTGDYVYGFQDLSFENMSQPAAWQVINPSTAGMSQTSHSGDQFMLSVSTSGSDGQGTNLQNTNHWLISPELTGEAQTISFYVAETTTQYGAETYQVLYSTTDNNPASFTAVGTYTASSTSWASQSVALPAGAKYFAIRHTSYDIFGLLVDDVTYKAYIPTPPDSYNIYLDGVLVGNVSSSNALSYTFNNLTSGQHVCAVSAVYPGGMESAQVSAIIPSFDPVTSGTVAPNAVDFGTKNIGGSYTATVTVTNTGNQSFTPTIDVTNLPQGITVSPTTSGALAANGTLDLTVTFEPTAEQSYSGTFTVTIPVPDDNDIVVTVTVTGAGYYGNKVISNTTAEIPVYKSATQNNDATAYSVSDIDDDTDHSLPVASSDGDVSIQVLGNTDITGYELFRSQDSGSNWTSVATATNSNNTYTQTNHSENTVTVADGATAWLALVDEATATGADALYVPVTNSQSIKQHANTYGAPRQSKTVTDLNALVCYKEMSAGNDGNVWEEDGKKYTHYKILLDIDNLVIPTDENDATKDYDLYKVRVWRQIDTQYLNEEYYTAANRQGYNRQERITDDFLMEEVDHSQYSLSSVTNTGSGKYYLGSNEDLESFHSNWTQSGTDETMGTFGAQKLRQSAEETGVIDELPMTFIVRAYYTRTANLDQSLPAGSHAPKRDDNPNADGLYYIVEHTFDYTLEADDPSIVTGVNTVVADRQVVDVTYVNTLGQQSNKPFDGVNIVVTRYSDGSIATSKVLK